MMMEKFAKLLLGEEMFGGGKGISYKLRSHRWEKKKIDWPLSVTDHIVEFVASKQKPKDGSNTKRSDLQMRMAYYEKRPSKNEKWWIPTPNVPPNGLSEVTRKWLQYQKDSVHQVLKAAMAINAQVLTEMEIPESYIEALLKVCKKKKRTSLDHRANNLPCLVVYNTFIVSSVWISLLYIECNSFCNFFFLNFWSNTCVV